MDFKQVEKKFEKLKAQFVAGTLSEAEFKTQLEELMLQDEQGSWWMIGYETEKWYRYNSKDWVQTDPPGASARVSTPPPLKQEIGASIPRTNLDEQRPLWKFGKQQIWRGLLGAVLYGILSILPAFGLNIAVLTFFSISYGPWVGLITGMLGELIRILVYSFI